MFDFFKFARKECVKSFKLTCLSFVISNSRCDVEVALMMSFLPCGVMLLVKNLTTNTVRGVLLTVTVPSINFYSWPSNIIGNTFMNIF